MAIGAGSAGLGTFGWVTAGTVVVAAAAGGLYYAGVFAPQPDPPAVVSEAALSAPKPVTPTVQPEPEAVTKVPVDSAEPEGATAEPETTAKTTVEPLPVPETESVPVAQENPEPKAADAPIALAPLNAPTFDIVRVDPDGSAVIAGTGPAGASVTILLDGEEQDVVAVDASGKFVSLLFLDPSDGARLLTLVARFGDQTVESDDQIILAPAPRPETKPVVVAEAKVETSEPPVEPVDVAVAVIDPAPMPEVTPEPIVKPAMPVAKPVPVNESAVVAEIASVAEPKAVAEPAPLVESALVAKAEPVAEPAEVAEVAEVALTAEPVPVAEAKPAAELASVAEPNPVAEPEPIAEPAAPAPVAVLRADAEGVELLQPATAPDPEDVATLVLDTIGYSDAGDVLLSGRGEPESVIRIYLDNSALTDLIVKSDGRWRGKMDGIEPGLYTLRLDALDAAGKVLSRLETPFVRENPEDLRPPEPQLSDLAEASSTKPAPTRIRVVTVQTGDTLWAISRERYGDGVLYVKVFEANRHHIRNPHLIYPGQVFTIPD